MRERGAPRPGDPQPAPSPVSRPLPHTRLAAASSPCQDSIPLGNGPTLSLNSITFDSAGTYICEASMPTVPLLSRAQSFKLLVQGSGWGRFGGGTAGGRLWGWGSRPNETGPRLVPLSSVPVPSVLLFLSPSFPFSDGPPALPPPPPAGPPELRAEETQPRSEGSWREGDEVRLVCSARGYPEPKLSWSQLGGSVRDLPPPSRALRDPGALPQTPWGILPSPRSWPATPRGTGRLHLCPHPSP